MRRLLEAVARWCANRGQRRIIEDHLDPSVEYMHRHYLLGGRLGADGTVVHGRVEVCLHKILTSDNDWLHSHPTAYLSVILAGSYLEHAPEGAFLRRPGHIRVRGRKSLHRLELVNGPVWTLFMFMNRAGDESKWGFFIGGRMIPHQVHLKEHA